MAEHDVVVAEEHDDDVDLPLLVEPCGEVAIGGVVGRLGSRVAFVVVVRAGELGFAVLGADLGADHVVVVDAGVVEFLA